MKISGRPKTVFKFIFAIAFVLIVIFYVSVPTISKYQKPVTQTEAKRALAMIFSAEKAFAVDNKEYITDLKGIGIDCDEAKVYSFGFLFPGTINVSPEGMNLDARRMQCERKMSPNSKEEISQLEKLCPECTAAADRFKAIAWGFLPHGKLDVWTYDQDRKLVHLVDGSAD